MSYESHNLGGTRRGDQTRRGRAGVLPVRAETGFSVWRWEGRQASSRFDDFQLRSVARVFYLFNYSFFVFVGTTGAGKTHVRRREARGLASSGSALNPERTTRIRTLRR